MFAMYNHVFTYRITCVTKYQSNTRSKYAFPEKCYAPEKNSDNMM